MSAARVGRSCVKLNKELWTEILESVDTVLFDADGVLWNGNTPIPGSADAVQRLSDMHNIVTTSWVLSRHLTSINFSGKVYVIGSSGIGKELDLIGIPHIGIGSDNFDNYAGDEDFLYEVPLDPEVKAVAVGFDGRFSYVKCMKAASYLSNPECLFIATNNDHTVPSAKPHFVLPGTGSVVVSVKEASRRHPVVLGKPHTPMFEAIQTIFPTKVTPHKTLMIGDRCGTDIRFANNNGLQSLFVLSGDSLLSVAEEYKKQEDMSYVPDFYTDTLGDILQLCP